MTDTYSSFAELKQHETEDADYTIIHREGDSKIAVMAIHGGGIEPGTIDIADAVAGCEHTFYAFKGLKKIGNKVLHIGSSRFDEETGMKVAQAAFIVISIHGSGYEAETVHIGGKNRNVKQQILHSLQSAGFNSEISEIPGLRGISRDNICNRCRCGKGVQLEISRGLREKMFENLDHRSLRRKTNVFYQFVAVLREVLAAI